TPDSASSTILFADGSAAVLVSNCIRSEKKLQLTDFYSKVAYRGKKDMAWELSHRGFIITLSSYIPDLIEQDIAALVEEAVQHSGLSMKDIRMNMRELNTVNTWLGGHAITIAGFKKILGKKKSIHVCEIGCGDGNNLYQLYKWCKKNQVKFHCTGIDIKPECIETAKKDYALEHSVWIVQDYKTVAFSTKPDIIFSSLFCHHFKD